MWLQSWVRGRKEKCSGSQAMLNHHAACLNSFLAFAFLGVPFNSFLCVKPVTNTKCSDIKLSSQSLSIILPLITPIIAHLIASDYRVVLVLIGCSRWGHTAAVSTFTANFSRAPSTPYYAEFNASMTPPLLPENCKPYTNMHSEIKSKKKI